MGTATTKPESTEKQLGTLQFIPIDKIDIGENFRKTIDKAGLKELADSIRQRGILVPLLVKKGEKNGRYDLIAGQRRLLAAKEAGLNGGGIPCIVTGFDAPTAEEVQVVENLQREDLHPLEEAVAYKKLTDSDRSIENLAAYVGKSEAYIRQRMQLNNLIEQAKKLFRDRVLNISSAFLVARQTQEIQKDLFNNYLRGGGEVSTSHLADTLIRHYMLDLAKAPFDTTDPELYPEAGPCTTCPKRTGCSPSLFPDIKKKDTCTDPVCFHEKERRFVKIQVGTHKDAVVLTVGQAHQKEKAKGSLDWVKAGKESCPDTKEGVIVEILGYSEQEAKLGQVLKVCLNQKCKTHHPPAPKSDYSPRNGGSRDAEKKRKIELRRRGLVFKAIAETRFATTTTDARTMLDWAVLRLGSDHARAICNAMQWDVPKAEMGKDYHGTIKKNLAKLDVDGVERWLFLVMLADTELWFYNNLVQSPSWKNLETKAKAGKVALDELAKQAKQKPVKPKVAAKPKKKKG